MRARWVSIAAVLLVAALGAMFWRILADTRAKLAEGERAQKQAVFTESAAGVETRIEFTHQLLRTLADSAALSELVRARGRRSTPDSWVYRQLDELVLELGEEPALRGLWILGLEEGPALLAFTRDAPAPAPLEWPRPPAFAARADAASATYALGPNRELLAATRVEKGGTALLLVEVEFQEALDSWIANTEGGVWALLDHSGRVLAGHPSAGESPGEGLSPGETVVVGDHLASSMPLEAAGWALVGRVPTQVAGQVVRELGGVLLLATAVVLLVLFIGLGTSEARARLNYVQRSLVETERQERFLQAMFDAITDVLVVVAPDGEVIRANRVAREIYGSDLVGQTYEEAFARRSSDHPRDVEALQEVFRSGQRGSAEVISPDGARVWAVARFPSFSADSAVQNVVEVSRDVSRELLLQAQLVQSEKLSTLGEMAAGIAHEINNPLGVVSMFAQLLGEEIRGSLGEEAPALEKVRTIEEQTTHVGEIVKNLLRFARKSGGEKHALDIRVALDRALGIAEHQKAHRALELSREDDVDPPPQVLGDEGQLAQVVLNLVVNARHAMDGSGRMTVVVRRKGPDDPDPPGRSFGDVPASPTRILLSVSDTGSGIEPEVVERLFEPFFTTKPVGEGTGLGLSVSFGIVRDHGGCMWVHSLPGEGTTFTLDLPSAE